MHIINYKIVMSIIIVCGDIPMSVITFAEVEPWEKNYITRYYRNYQGTKHTVNIIEEKLTCDNVHQCDKNTEILSTFIYSRIDKSVIDYFPHLKLIATRSTGYDHIDIDVCKERNIAVANVPSYGENTVAEHAFGLILNLTRNIHRAYLKTQLGDYTIDESLMGTDIQGKTIGVIGGGRIGLHIARMAHGFRMNILVYDVRKDHFLETLIGFRYVEFDELLSSSDIIVLSVPLNEKTRHIINKSAIEKMKDGVFIVNIARGGLIDTPALFEALDKGKIAGAGLDVIEGEELLAEDIRVLKRKSISQAKKSLLVAHKILERDNVVYTPHIAFYSREALERILNATFDNIENFLKGVTVNNVINRC